MGFMFCDLHVSLNNPSSGDINSSNLPCSFCIPTKLLYDYLNTKLFYFLNYKKFYILDIYNKM